MREIDEKAPLSVHLCEFPSADKSLMDEKLVQRIAMVRGLVEMGRVIRATNNIKNRMPIASMTVVAHGEVEKNVAETMKDLILEELNVREMKFLEDETKLVKLSAKPNFLAIKAKGPDYAKNMKVISAKLSSLSVDEIKALQAGNTIKFDFGEGLCKFLSVKSIIHEKGPSMAYKQKVEFPLPIFGFATN